MSDEPTLIEKAEQMLASKWGRVVEDEVTRTLSYAPNNRPRELAEKFVPLAKHAEELERVLARTTELLDGINKWLVSAGEYVGPTKQAIDQQVLDNRQVLSEKEEQ